MKPLSALLFASLALGACEKSDNVTQLHQEAVAVAKYYAPRADDLAKRRDAIFQRGRNVPGNLPDVPEVVRLIGEAGDKINEMKGITASIEKQADDAAKAKKTDELARLIDESHEKIDADETVANEDLSRVEGWLWEFEQGHGGAASLPKAPQPPANDVSSPQPPATGSGGGEAVVQAVKPEQTENKPHGGDKTEKAAQKAATEKVDTKTGQPKTDSKAPKATGSGAGSAK